MDKDLLIQNVIKYCTAANVLPTKACIEAGVGKSFMSSVRSGKIPSVAKVADLAAYLGVATSDLVGDAQMSSEDAELLRLFHEINPEGQEKTLSYMNDLISSGNYIKNYPNQLDSEENG